MKKEIRRTMKSMSISEVESRQKLNLMVPLNITGRHQIMTKLKDLVVDIDDVIVKPVIYIPTIIRRTESFFSTDGYWKGNFIAYGTDLFGNETLLWDDIMVEDMPHYETMVETLYIKKKLDSSKPVTLVVSTVIMGKHTLNVYCYNPQ